MGLHKFVSNPVSEEILSRSRWIEKLFDISHLAPASISIYPQGSAHLVLFCLIVFGPMPIINPILSWPKYFISLFILFYCSNGTIFLIYIIYLFIFSILIRKYLLTISIILISLVTFEISHLSNPDIYNLYKYLWLKNFNDVFNYSEFLIFGFNSDLNINNFVETFELGVIQILVFCGVWPLILNLLFYFIYVYSNVFKKRKLLSVSWFQYTGLIMITASLLSMIHYLSFSYSSIQYILALHTGLLILSKYNFNIRINQPD